VNKRNGPVGGARMTNGPVEGARMTNGPVEGARMNGLRSKNNYPLDVK